MPYIVGDKMHFLSEASKILSSSIDYNVTLAVVAKLLVTNIADFCIIDILEGHKLKRLAVKVSDPTKQKLALKMFDFIPNPKNKLAIYDTAKLGTPVIIPKATKRWLRTVSRIEEERKVIQELALNSHLFVPLKSRGEVIGVLTIASMDKNFSYSNEDAVFIEELATRIAIAVDKARLYSEAQNALQMRDEFLSIASHELKTPLTSILLNLQGVLKKISNINSKEPQIEEIRKMVELSKHQSDRMTRLINDLLNVSVASTGRLKIEKEKMDLSALVEDVLLQFKTKLESSHIKVIFKNKEKIVGRWDKIRLEQVISNLLSNAIKYGNNKPIVIELRKEEKSAVFIIKDNGIGIGKKDQEMIFQQFRRAVAPQTYSGLGVGLYISNQIVDAHKGSIFVSSIPGKGSTFTVILPL
jgi:signal transduction histidine kinase